MRQTVEYILVRLMLINGMIVIASSTALVVPDMSYSSSEGEDDFFDANDSIVTPGSQAPTPT